MQVSAPFQADPANIECRLSTGSPRDINSKTATSVRSTIARISSSGLCLTLLEVVCSLPTISLPIRTVAVDHRIVDVIIPVSVYQIAIYRLIGIMDGVHPFVPNASRAMRGRVGNRKPCLVFSTSNGSL
jgi:hypothetical protein